MSGLGAVAGAYLADMAAHAIAAEERLVPVEEYLRTMYHPDCDYVDGRVEERNVGEFEHAGVQKVILRLLWAKEEEWRINAIQECRLQVSPARFRVPDGMVLRAEQVVDQMVREVPLLCIEVLSPEDTWKRLRGVLGDYLAMGVKHIWAFDPEERVAYRFDADGFHPVADAEMVVEGTEVRLVVAEVFALLPAR